MKNYYLTILCFALWLLCTPFCTAWAQASNPILEHSDLPYGAPKFDRIKIGDIKPAIEQGLAEYENNLKHIRAISPRKATFENVICAMDLADSTLSKATSILSYMRSSFSNDAVMQVSVESAPIISAFGDKVSFDEKIFTLIKTLHNKRFDMGLDSLQIRTLEKRYRSYVRNGALCSKEQKRRLAEINAELSVKRIKHGNNIVKATEEYVYFVSDSSMLDGLSSSTKRRFAQRAEKLGKSGQWAIGLTNGDNGVVVANANNRALRKTIYEANDTRCNGDGKYDNRQLSVDIINLRRERAQILGYDTYSDYVLETNMAEKPQNVYDLLLPLTKAAISKGEREMEQLREYASRLEGGEFELQPWDISFYSNKMREEQEVNTGDIRNYFLFENVCNGVFYVAEKLYGIRFSKRDDIPTYHPDVEVYEITDKQGNARGLLYLDCFVRSGKRVGAWCYKLRSYNLSDGVEQMPLITISCNFSTPHQNRPRLLPAASVKTLFHEFGHALAGILARGPYSSVTGNFPRDMVELPSQINEHWAWEPEVLKHYAFHYKTGEPIPTEMIERLERSNNFQKGLYLTDYYASTLLDLEWHGQSKPIEKCDIDGFEQAFLKRYGFPAHTAFRYRTTFFNHMFASSYPSQYYVYTWAAVLDSDAFAAFTETGDIFNEEVAQRFEKYILTEIGYDEPAKQYIKFRGKLPTPEVLMNRYRLTN